MEEHYRADEISLGDGLRVRVRAISREDAPRLQAFVARLSPQTIFLRTLTAMKELSDRDAARLARVDYDQSMALVATLGTHDDDRIVAVARYSSAGQPIPGQAEVAIVVEDAYQKQGLGRELLARLAAYAGDHGITKFVATISSNNDAVMHMIRRTGLPAAYHELGHSEREVTIELTPGAGDQDVG